MKNKNINVAAIDIGSNAVRLHIASIDLETREYSARKELMVRVPLRLGQDAFVHGKIKKEKYKKVIKLMKAFKQLMSIYDIVEMKACATSAMRDAGNSQELVDEILEKTGIPVEIISGHEEANLIYESHFADKLDHAKNHLYVDVGGGSTEISLIVDGELKNSTSFEIGTVRLLNDKVMESEWEALSIYLKEIDQEYKIENIIGSGGNIIKINKLIGHGQSEILHVQDLKYFYAQIKDRTPDELMKEYKFRPDRADVIGHAARIFLSISDSLTCNNIIVPTIGLSDGIIHKLYNQWKTRTK